jgi:hypothetical protein
MTKDKDLDLGKTKTVSAEELGFVPVVPIDSGEKTSVFSQLLSGTEDDERAVEPTDDDLGTLEQEWQKLCSLKESRDAAEARLKELKRSFNDQKLRMADAMERQGTKQFRGAAGGGCTITETYTTVLADEVAFMGWVKETHPELLTVHSQTRTKFIRENYRDEGVPEDDPSFPPGLKPGVLAGLQVRGARPTTTAEKQGE